VAACLGASTLIFTAAADAAPPIPAPQDLCMSSSSGDTYVTAPGASCYFGDTTLVSSGPAAPVGPPLPPEGSGPMPRGCDNGSCTP
jgi:hypothetical protein